MVKQNIREIEQEIEIKKEIESVLDDKKIKLPAQVKEVLENSLKTPIHIHMPVIVFRDGEWFIAQNPVLDLCAQGKTEEEAIRSLKSMGDDYLSDPDTVKTGLCMDISVRTISMKVPVNDCEGAGSYSRENTPVAER